MFYYLVPWEKTKELDKRLSLYKRNRDYVCYTNTKINVSTKGPGFIFKLTWV
jgi:hypothetical protein